jgi:uncharacterized membrane protein YcaP (DUF421 family)
VNWLIGGWTSLWQVAAKAGLMYVTALVGLRLAERRTLAQWTIIDFAAAVAMGAIIGRTAVASNQSYVVGAAALASIIVLHRIGSLLRLRPVLGKLVDHRLRVLVADGSIREHELHRCGLTENDLFGQLRQRGVYSLEGIRYVLYETKGSISVVPATEDGRAELVDVALETAVGFPAADDET